MLKTGDFSKLSRVGSRMLPHKKHKSDGHAAPAAACPLPFGKESREKLLLLLYYEGKARRVSCIQKIKSSFADFGRIT